MWWIYITIPSYGFPYHGYPYDYWRYEIEDMYKIFSDFEILVIERNPLAPGVFLKARKPIDWESNDLSRIALYSIVLGRRTERIVSFEDASVFRRFMFKFMSSKVRWLLPGFVLGILSKKYLT